MQFRPSIHLSHIAESEQIELYVRTKPILD